MSIKTRFSENDFQQILLNYNLGYFIKLEPITSGAVQTNYFLTTSKDKFVFRYHENRTKESVLFESNLIKYLKNKNYPCPAIIKNKHGKMVELYKNKPYVIFEFVEGKHIENPNEDQKVQLIQKAAELQNLTKNYRPINKKYRWNYSVELAGQLATREADKLETANVRAKLEWFKDKLTKLQLPQSLPKGICHCDFHFSNVLFKNDQLNALIDFDDANYTYLTFDLVGLIEAAAWQFEKDKVLNFKEARKVIDEYMKYRTLNNNEKRHLFDVYKLSILFDCIWRFERGNVKDFYEKRKTEFLDSVGREEFYNKLFR